MNIIYYYNKKKYSNCKVCIDGEEFDSKKEAKRYQELLLLQRAGKIKNLQRQVRFTLIPSQKMDDKIVERECSYIADFTYNEILNECKRDNCLMCEHYDSKNKVPCGVNLVVEDTKGVRTKDYIIKRKLMLWRFGIKISEI